MVILRRWSVAFPALAIVAMALTWGSHPGTPVLVVAGLLLAGAVLAAVHHAEVVAHRVGEPFGSLVLAVVGLAKVESDPIEDAVESIGAPQSAVGVLIALLVLLPETLAAVRNAQRDRVQTSFNLAYGSAIASIGLTIPAIAVATIWLDGPLVLGLGSMQIVLLGITMVVGALTVLPGRATVQEGGVHLVLFLAFVFLALNP
jgi:Ca2+/H+ antiporter